MWRRWRKSRQDRQDMSVLGSLTSGKIFAVDVWKHIGGSYAEVQISLRRLERQGLVDSHWTNQPGLPICWYSPNLVSPQGTL